MQLRYDEQFLESAVFLCATGKHGNIPALQIRRFHREREKLYSILDSDERNSAFFKLHAEWFREWGLEKLLASFLNDFPMLSTELNVLAFRKARNKNEEGAELYVNGSEKNGVIALRTERFEFSASLNGFLNHEFTHLRDMVDPAFGYSRDLPATLDPMHQRLIRERYRLLWDITIDGRLINSNKPTVASLESRREEFNRAYSFWSAQERDAAFQTLWTAPNPQHNELVRLASDPRNVAEQHQPLPGAPCPLCGFPTFQWADAAKLSEQVCQILTRDFPQWKPQYGACNRCAEIYKAVAKATQYNQPMFALS